MFGLLTLSRNVSNNVDRFVFLSNEINPMYQATFVNPLLVLQIVITKTFAKVFSIQPDGHLLLVFHADLTLLAACQEEFSVRIQSEFTRGNGKSPIDIVNQ